MPSGRAREIPIQEGIVKECSDKCPRWEKFINTAYMPNCPDMERMEGIVTWDTERIANNFNCLYTAVKEFHAFHSDKDGE